MLKLTRRSALATTAAFMAFPRSAFAAERVQIGEWELVTLSDGHLTLPADLVFAPAPATELAALASTLGIHDLDAPLTPPCNVTLLRAGSRTILFDCGAGSSFQASVGRLPDALAAEGLAAEDITDVVFTHAHPDHFWGVLDDFDEPLFHNATHWIGRRERDYWIDPDTVDTIGAERASFAVGAARRLDAIAGVLEVFEDEQEFLPGVMATLTPGHTPGHMSFEINAGGTAAMIIGDAVGNDHVALARPQWHTGSDQDPDTGSNTRVSLLQRLANENLIMVGFHLPSGGIGRIEQRSDAFHFSSDV